MTLNRLDERYTLGEVLGEGRFSQVFSARRIELDIEGEVALKVMELNVVTEDDEALEMLEAECVALRLASEHERLRHRVVRLHEVISPVILSQAAACPSLRRVSALPAAPHLSLPVSVYRRSSAPHAASTSLWTGCMGTSCSTSSRSAALCRSRLSAR